LPTEIATLRSHKAILQHSLNLGLESVFILEDDVDFTDDFINKLKDCLKELPEDWDGIHLGGYSPNGSTVNYSIMLNKCFASWGGYGYIVNKSAIPIILQEIENEEKQIDTYIAGLMPQLKWFKTKEKLVLHPPNQSTILNKWVDYKDLY
jgi:GR25 family glycosyltransferase involved in LPS biosynthesis